MKNQGRTRRADGDSGLQMRSKLLCSNHIFDTLPAFIRWFHSMFGTADARGRAIKQLEQLKQPSAGEGPHPRGALAATVLPHLRGSSELKWGRPWLFPLFQHLQSFKIAPTCKKSPQRATQPLVPPATSLHVASSLPRR